MVGKEVIDEVNASGEEHVAAIEQPIFEAHELVEDTKGAND